MLWGDQEGGLSKHKVRVWAGVGSWVQAQGRVGWALPSIPAWVEQQVGVQQHVPHFHKGELVHRRFPLG